MDLGDLIFYGIIAISVISSISKAIKKKPEESADGGMPDFKGTQPKPRDIFKTVLEELTKEDDFYPTNPKPAQPVQPAMASTSGSEKNKPFASTTSRFVTENTPRRDSFSKNSNIDAQEIKEDLSDPILQKLDIRQPDELKKAIIYSEILRPKF